MLNKLLTTKNLYAIAGLFLLWLLISWLGGGDSAEQVSAQQSRLQQNQDEDMVSSIQPITEGPLEFDEAPVKTAPVNTITIDTKPDVLDEADNRSLHEGFEQALASQESGRIDEAIDRYQALIDKFPRVPENYINLANLYGVKGDLQTARTTLKQGVDANEKASALVQSLESVHSALASRAYRKALDVNSQEPANVAIALPMVLELQTSLDLQDEVQRLKTSILAEAESSAGTKELVSDYLGQIQSLNDQLSAEKQNALTADAAKLEQISSLTQSLAQSEEALAVAQAAEREALARVVRAEQNAKIQIEQANIEVISLKAELEQQQVALLTAQNQQEREQQTLLATREKERQEELINTQATASKPLISDVQEQQAIARVKSWAKAWSDQNVDTYVDHYVDTYSPESAGSREVWLDQRRVRLTNKKFINVGVSSFTVSDLGDQFSVRFRQHYKSDVIDDVIFKRLVFTKNASDDWSISKIVGERVVPPN